jgi:hypothetical protein
MAELSLGANSTYDPGEVKGMKAEVTLFWKKETGRQT